MRVRRRIWANFILTSERSNVESHIVIAREQVPFPIKIGHNLNFGRLDEIFDDPSHTEVLSNRFTDTDLFIKTNWEVRLYYFVTMCARDILNYSARE